MVVETEEERMPTLTEAKKCAVNVSEQVVSKRSRLSSFPSRPKRRGGDSSIGHTPIFSELWTMPSEKRFR